MIAPFAGSAPGSPAAVHHRHRIELDPPRRLRGHSALADGAVQREDAGRPRPRHRLDRQARSGGRARARSRSSGVSARFPSRPAPSSSTSSPPPRRARPRTAWTSSTAPKQILGTEIRVLSGREEAHYSALGVISGFHPANGIAGDLGGGSLELVDVNGDAIGDGITLPLGGLRLQDLAKGSLVAAQKFAREQLARARLLAGGRGQGLLCRRRHLAKPRQAAHERHQLSAGGHAPLRDGHRELGQLSCARSARGDIDKISGIDARLEEPPRACCPTARSCCRRSSRRCGPPKIVVSALGVREGFLYSLLSPDEQRTDPLISAAEELALLRARSVTHARELADWTGTTFAAFGIEETEDEVRYRRAACLLADIGWRAHPEYRGTQSLNIIAHASFIGIDHPGRAFIGAGQPLPPRRHLRRGRSRRKSRRWPRRAISTGRGCSARCCASSTCCRRRCRASCRGSMGEPRQRRAGAGHPASHRRPLWRAAGRPPGAARQDHRQEPGLAIGEEANANSDRE